jgi:hypothetical protein
MEESKMMNIGANRGNSHSFQTYPMVNHKRSAFNLSHSYKTAFDSGKLIPFFAEIAYPGDTFNVRANCFARLSTPVVPFMDNIYLDTFWFAVPYRLVWTNFKKFMGEQTNPGDSISYTIPRTQAPASGFTVGSLYDYFGIPTVGQITGGAQHYVNNLFPRAYNLIWNEWFRDQNMQSSLTVDVGDGPDTYTNYIVRNRGKRFDYFTSCLTSPQKGTAVSLPLGTSARIASTSGAGSDVGIWSVAAAAQKQLTGGGAGSVNISATGTAEELYADLSAATAATINEFRYALQVQSLLEKDARAGTRYAEIVRSHFGVVHPDLSWRPELLGTNSTPIKINPIAQSSSTSGSLPLGLLGAFGVVGTAPYGFVKSFTEHNLVIGLVSVRAELTYQQGLHRMWTDQTRYDMYWPALAHVGEQAVYTKELYFKADSAIDDDVFGYQERYAHLRYKPSQITGILRGTAANNLDVWHLAQEFSAQPTLGDTFIKETPPLDRVQAVTTEPQFIFDSWIDFTAVRPLPVYGIPANLARF